MLPSVSMLQPGDVLAFRGTDRVARLIEFGTLSLFSPAGLRLGYSHVGIVARIGGEMKLVESTSLSHLPCDILGEPVYGLQCHDPGERVWDYAEHGGTADVYRLTPLNALTGNETAWLGENCERLIRDRIGYDMIGAGMSGTRVFSHLKMFPGADLAKLFCSEFVAWILQILNRMNRDNPGRYNPARLLRELVRTGVYRRELHFYRTGNSVSAVTLGA